MKKLTAAVLTALLAAGLAVSASALPARTAELSIPRVGEKTPVIDGKFDVDEGWGQPLVWIDSFSYENYVTRQDDPSHTTDDIKGYYRWDDQHMYFCCVVEDSDHANPTQPGSNPWAGDSIRFDIQTDLACEDLNLTSKYWFALCDDGEVYFFHEKTEPGVDVMVTAEMGGDIVCTEYVVARDEARGVTVYEASVLWEYNTPAGTEIKEGYQFVTAQRVMEMSTGDPEPTQSVQLCGYEADSDNPGTKWFVATLTGAVEESTSPALPEPKEGYVEETEAPAPETEPETEAPAPETEPETEAPADETEAVVDESPADEAPEADEAPAEPAAAESSSSAAPVIIAVVAVVVIAAVVIVVLKKKKN